MDYPETDRYCILIQDEDRIPEDVATATTTTTSEYLVEINISSQSVIVILEDCSSRSASSRQPRLYHWMTIVTLFILARGYDNSPLYECELETWLIANINWCPDDDLTKFINKCGFCHFSTTLLYTSCGCSHSHLYWYTQSPVATYLWWRLSHHRAYHSGN